MGRIYSNNKCDVDQILHRVRQDAIEEILAVTVKGKQAAG